MGPSNAAAKFYEVVMDPQVTGITDNLAVLSFDILSFDINDNVNSWLYLESVTVHEVNY